MRNRMTRLSARTFEQNYECPVGHHTHLTWRASEVSELLAADGLKFYCSTCNETRPASAEEVDPIRRALGLVFSSEQVGTAPGIHRPEGA
jgi:hypothetical protein